MSRRAPSFGASGVALAILGAFSVSAGCDKGAEDRKPPLIVAPVIIVTKKEITLRDQMQQRESAGTAKPALSCGTVMEHLNTALFTYEPAYMPLAGTYAPRVLASCDTDGWPDALKQCIIESSPRALLDHACDSLVSDELARKIIARVAPGQLRPEDLLRR